MQTMPTIHDHKTVKTEMAARTCNPCTQEARNTRIQNSRPARATEQLSLCALPPQRNSTEMTTACTKHTPKSVLALYLFLFSKLLPLWYHNHVFYY